MAQADDWRMVEKAPQSEQSKVTAALSEQYRAPNGKTFAALERAFEYLLIANDQAPLSTLYSHSTTATLPRFSSVDDKGWGEIWFNQQAKGALFLQVPHRYFDSHTYQIAQQWWHGGQFKLWMANSVHRYASRDSAAAKGEHKSNSDFSTARLSPFVAATRAFSRSTAKPLILQLHGYNKDKRRSKLAKQSDVILSHGANLPGPYLTHLSQAGDCMVKQMGLKAVIFPHDVMELGGTKNIVGKHLRSMGHYQRFFHIELSQSLRQKLVKNPAVSLQLLSCILGSIDD